MAGAIQSVSSDLLGSNPIDLYQIYCVLVICAFASLQSVSVTPFLRLVRQRCVAERKGETDGLLPNDKPSTLQNQTDEPNFEPSCHVEWKVDDDWCVISRTFLSWPSESRTFT